MGANDLVEHCGLPLEFRLPTPDLIARKGGPLEYIPERAECKVCSTYFERKPGSVIAYRYTDICMADSNFVCTECGSPVMSKLVLHKVMRGKPYRVVPNRFFIEGMPFCPSCENEPADFGRPLKV